MTIKQELMMIRRLKEKNEKCVYDVFNKYIKDNKIDFSNPDAWDVEKDGILFCGYDYAYGASESKTLKIPMGYFIEREIKPKVYCIECGEEIKTIYDHGEESWMATKCICNF